jgi:phenylalanyl-tRNA synthetase alpha subunit
LGNSYGLDSGLYFGGADASASWDVVHGRAANQKRSASSKLKRWKNCVEKLKRKKMIPIVASLLGSLAQNGLTLLSSAIQAKGKEVVENTLGVKIPDNPTPEDVSNLRQLQFEHEERLLELGIEKAKMELAELELLADAAQERRRQRNRPLAVGYV